jgi:glycosyltransferase involved in cell wall biosynthesis
MKIAIFSVFEETVPPTKYGGTEWIVYHVARGMGLKGHEVDLYASGDSKKDPAYNLIPVVEKSIRTDPTYGLDPKMRETIKFLTYSKFVPYLDEKKYDIIHNHAVWRFLLFTNLLKTPIVTTHHGPLSLPYQNMVYAAHKDRPYVSISNNQRRDFPDLNWAATVYNGIDINSFQYSEDAFKEAEPYLFLLARISPEKGAVEAAQVALKTHKTLKVAAKVDIADKEYADKFQSLVDGKYVDFLGEKGMPEKMYLLQGAKALLAPVSWEEPFGLYFTEAMACGTPVIAFARGAAPEIIEDGKSGFLVNFSDDMKRGDFIIKKTGVEGLCEAVEMLYSLPEDQYIEMRRNARKRIEEKFTYEHMVNGYEEVYKKIINQ